MSKNEISSILQRLIAIDFGDPKMAADFARRKLKLY
jgi:hypothetical protein